MNMVMTSRLCWNCEGDVEADSGSCPYCGVDLGGEESPPEQTDTFEPAFRVVQSVKEAPVPEPAYRIAPSGTVSEQTWNESINGERGQQEMKVQVEGIKGWLLPLVMLLSGSVFLLFGLVLFLFSEDGVFTLRWNANFSLLYLVGAIPLLYYGWNSLQSLED